MRARSRWTATSHPRAQREPHVDAETPVPGAFALARSAHQSRPLAHADEAEPAAGGAVNGGEADPVVAHVQVEPILVAAQRDIHPLGPRMLAGVGERFLEDAEG